MIVCVPSQGVPSGCLYYVHGGGMVAGSPRDGPLEMLGYASEMGLVVVSVAYRLAPEHAHPVPVEDCYSGLVWASELPRGLRSAQKGAFGSDPRDIRLDLRSSIKLARQTTDVSRHTWRERCRRAPSTRPPPTR
ncbi:alpha/beta hydrolase [Microbacterium phyllosphaerae]|uniref:alpha/beta hydrolase n=1 Tax=Microbacterium phyllosphaerae TaxID=124798 RepID=UPI002166D09E